MSFAPSDRRATRCKRIRFVTWNTPMGCFSKTGFESPATEQLPCASCTAMCCGPVPISESRVQQIHEHLRTMPAEERQRLAKQERGELDCHFLDKENYRCAIYPVRPWVCE